MVLPLGIYNMNRLEAIVPFADVLNLSFPFYCIILGKGILGKLLSNLIISERHSGS